MNVTLSTSVTEQNRPESASGPESGLSQAKYAGCWQESCSNGDGPSQSFTWSRDAGTPLDDVPFGVTRDR